MQDAAELGAKVGRVLEALGVSYVVGGSYASSIYGDARSTNDVDLIADVRLQHVSALVSALQGDFYVDEGAVVEAVKRNGSFNLIHYETSFKVDIFVQGQHAFRRAAIAHRIPTTTFGCSSHCVPEDIVLAKLDCTAREASLRPATGRRGRRAESTGRQTRHAVSGGDGPRHGAHRPPRALVAAGRAALIALA